MNRKGFTLIEVLIAVVLLSEIAAKAVMSCEDLGQSE